MWYVEVSGEWFMRPPAAQQVDLQSSVRTNIPLPFISQVTLPKRWGTFRKVVTKEGPAVLQALLKRQGKQWIFSPTASSVLNQRKSRSNLVSSVALPHISGRKETLGTRLEWKGSKRGKRSCFVFFYSGHVRYNLTEKEEGVPFLFRIKRMSLPQT